jgi:hypothetical protein
MDFAKLPIFAFADKSLMQLQTKWAQTLDKAVSIVGAFNTLTPTRQSFSSGSGIYKTPNNVFYLNVKMGATLGTTTFGVAY